MKQLTKDHSLVAQMVEHGHIRPEEAADHPQRSVITRALGAAIDVKVDTKTKEMAAGDRYLLATDGLTTGVTDPEIASIIAGEDDLDAAARRLIALANQRGGVDNVTVVLFESQVVDRRKDERGFRIGTKGLIAALLIVLVILGAWGTWSYLSSGIYLGEHNGKVAIYRGVPGSFLSVKMSHLVKETTVRTDSLPEPYRDRLAQGLPSKSLQGAENTVRGYESLGRERR
ncbi:MAG: hypothetical protein M1335_06785 [Chloroflexi bacterium]|nr:hypothetical protein [Chloroflexota bacterium]